MASKEAIKAGEAFVELSADDSRVTEVLSRFTNRLHKLGSNLRATGLSLAASGTLLTAPLAATFAGFISHADKLQDVADRMNTTTEAVSKLSYAADFSASSIEDVEAADRKLTQSAVAASRGSVEQSQAFAKLGLSAESFLEMSPDERFVQIAAAIEGIDSPLERSRLLFGVLGESASKLLPLLANGAEGLKELYQQAEDSGSIVSSEDAKKSAALMDMFDKALREVKNTLYAVGAAFLGFTDDVKGGSQSLSKFLKGIRDWIKDNQTLIVTVGAIGAALTVAGGLLIAFGLIASGVATGITALTAVVTLFGTVATGVFAAITSPIGICVALIAGLTAAFLTLTEAGRGIASSISATFASIGDTVKATFGTIVAAIKAGRIDVAWKVVGLGLLAIWQDVIAQLLERWHHFTNLFTDAFRNAIAAIRQAWVKASAWIQEKLINLLEVSIIPILEASDWVGITDNKVGEMENRIRKSRETIQRDKSESLKDIDAEGQAAKDAELTRQANRVKEYTDRRDDLRRQIAELNAEVAKQPEAVPDVNRAPMPHLPGRGESLMSQLGQSVKGVFQSADYRGALALGRPNSDAKDQLRKLTDIDLVLNKIHNKIEPGTFT